MEEHEPQIYIWLQWWDEDGDLNQEVTWSENQIHHTDLKYQLVHLPKISPENT